MKRNFSLLKISVLLTIAALVVVWVVAQPAFTQGQRDPFDKANEEKIDPFHVLKQAPAIDIKMDGKQPPKTDNVKPLPVAKNPLAERITFDVAISPSEAKRGQLVRVTVTGVPAQGWHTYGMTLIAPGQYPSVFIVENTPGLVPLGPITETPAPTPGKPTDGNRTWEHDGKFTWAFDVLVTNDAKIGPTAYPFAVDVQVCDKSCIFGKVPLIAGLTVLPGDVVPITAEINKRAQEKFPPPPEFKIPEGSTGKTGEPTSVAKSAGLPEDYQGSIDRIKKQIKQSTVKKGDDAVGKPAEDLMAFVLAGMFWGFISLVTPCVFPMIPITVSFFLKQSEKEHHKPVTMALVYCGTIVGVLTVAAVALLQFFQMLSINPLMNFGLGLLFVFFALSLFGMYEIELPSFMARFTSERESRGGMVGTIFMALTFTIISFACVAPFLGGFGGTAAHTTRPFWHTILGGLAFSVTFAAPFFVLAMFPTLLRAMPKSGAWLNSVKVVMGFLELAAAFKFFRAGELRLLPTPTLFTFDLVLGLWVAICLLCGLYLIGLYRLPHDSPVEHLSVPRLLFSFVFLGLGLYLLPGLFVKTGEDEQPRPDGVVYAWVNAFLLPDSKDELWAGNLEDAIAQARDYRQRTGKTKLIFVDFTGVNCPNCRLNEGSVFTKYEIRQLLKQYILVRMYTDTVPVVYYSPDDRTKVSNDRRVKDANINMDFQFEVFQSRQRPLYAILEPRIDNTIQVVGMYDEGAINSVSEFAQFLSKPQQKVAATVASR
ncbi:MAG TPA: cytochrome c biogenesis protein CcdA [Gemmataceae bacterium]|nr:cytochrome c biogenesis protein CcdA [Gemmataceae bacterium]